ncbi:MAG: polyphosphate kinase 1 [Myxococcales bacterium]|nr:polyphosphate kinase 1 [Myxococcales bacterium]
MSTPSEAVLPSIEIAAIGAAGLDDPAYYINRELSLLEFFRRVLATSADPTIPLLERLRFLTITSTITDEFFEIRVAGLKQRIQLGIGRPGADGLSPLETHRRISERVRAMIEEQYRTLNADVLPALEAEGIRLLKRSMWSESQRRWVRDYFDNHVAPVLTPVGLDPAHPFPRILNKSLNMIVSLEGTDAFGRHSDYAVVPVPRCLPRVIRMPADVAEAPHDFVLLSSVVHAHVEQVFPGMTVTGCHQFRVTRNADLWVDEEEVEDLLDALKGQLPRRRYGDAVRLEVADNCSDVALSLLRAQFGLGEADVFRVDGPVNLHRLETITQLVDRPDLKFAPFTPSLRQAGSGSDLFEVLSRGDLLLHHPYESFTPVVELLRQAAQDPDVLAIKQTVYRTGTQSPMVESLLKAARAGKEVTAVVELRARFDEAANIDLATKLQDAGAHVVYGVVGHKTHSKMLLIVRREGDTLRRYVHLGTGNYHTGTARAYTDFSFLTSRDDITRDVHHLFMQLTGLGRAEQLKRLLQSPFTLRPWIEERLAFEADEARAGRPARVIVKVNSLSDPGMIRALYRASQAGVSIDLIIRGICCLRPGIPGVSENIRVRSVIGRFLEHSRVYYFHAAGERRLYLASADWMGRNLYRRVEACFPIEHPELRDRLFDEGLQRYLDDNAGAWQLAADGSYTRVLPADGEPRKSAQEQLLARMRDPDRATTERPAHRAH